MVFSNRGARAARAGLVLVALLAGVGCAARTPPASRLPERPPADVSALIAEGCLSCLREALAIASGRDPRYGPNPEQAVEAAVLAAVRAKELGLLADERSLQPAATLALRAPGMAYAIDAADALPTDPLASDREVNLIENGRRRGVPGALPAWRDVLARSPGSLPFRAYLEVALACSYLGPRERGEVVAAVRQRVGDVPLVRYRIGTCGSEFAPEFAGLDRPGLPYVDADYIRGRYAVDGPMTNLDEAVARLTSAAVAFPDSASIVMLLGKVRQEREEWADALAAFDAAVALVPDHREARLGRVISLSHLNRHQEAIAAATELIGLGNWFTGEAYYWRAWNQFSRDDITAARADADSARALMANAPLFLLSGLIEWRERRLDTAAREFEETLKTDFGQCEAASYLGSVQRQRGEPAAALGAFHQARQCYGLAIAVRREYIQKIDSGSESDATKARRTASHRTAIADAAARRGEAERAIAELEKAIPAAR